mmetsp:Transcript_4858/g.10712  ORF Transcript_4858/g.10712 Transcript_4858/m.10712 type:complete len:109 (+) Transcript_4858:60-386(+)
MSMSQISTTKSALVVVQERSESLAVKSNWFNLWATMFSSLSPTGVSIVECFFSSSECFCNGVNVVTSRGVAHVNVADFHNEISISSSTRTIRIVGGQKQLVQLVGDNV